MRTARRVHGRMLPPASAPGRMLLGMHGSRLRHPARHCARRVRSRSCIHGSYRIVLLRARRCGPSPPGISSPGRVVRRQPKRLERVPAAGGGAAQAVRPPAAAVRGRRCRSAAATQSPAPLRRAQAPHGAAQPPPRARRTARSSSTAVRAGRMVERGQQARGGVIAACLHRQRPLPRGRLPVLRRQRQQAQTGERRVAAAPGPPAPAPPRPALPSRQRRSRVGTLPRASTHARPAGQSVRSRAARRGELVPTVAPPRSPRGAPRQSEPLRCATQPARHRRAARGGMAARYRPPRSSSGRSLRECTAAAASPRATAAATSEVNTPGAGACQRREPGSGDRLLAGSRAARIRHRTSTARLGPEPASRPAFGTAHVPAVSPCVRRRTAGSDTRQPPFPRRGRHLPGTTPA